MWFRVDDNLAFHAKVVMAGNAAMGLWVRAGSWSGQQLTDGFVPTQIAHKIGTRVEARRLVDVGLWSRTDDGYVFHEWGERQPTSEDVKRVAEVKGSAGARGNHLRWHKRRGVVAEGCEWCAADTD